MAGVTDSSFVQEGPMDTTFLLQASCCHPSTILLFNKLVHACLSSVPDEHKVLPDQFDFRPTRGVLQPLFVMLCTC